MTEIDPSDLPLVMDEPHSVLEDLLIDGSGAPDGCPFAIYFHADHCTVSNVFIKNMPKIGIGVRGVRRALVEWSSVEYSGMQGIWAERDCDEVCFRDNYVKNSGKDNIQIAGTNGSALMNRVEGAGNGQPNFAGIYVAANARGMTIERNRCTANGTGIDVSWGFQDGENRNGGDMSCGNTVHGNRCWLNNSCGIACASNGTIFTANHCIDNGVIPAEIASSGIGLVNANGCIVKGNQLINSRVGLLFRIYGAGTNASRNCIVLGNHFEGNSEFPYRQWFGHALSPVSTTRGHIIDKNFGA